MTNKICEALTTDLDAQERLEVITELVNRVSREWGIDPPQVEVEAELDNFTPITGPDLGEYDERAPHTIRIAQDHLEGDNIENLYKTAIHETVHAAQYEYYTEENYEDDYLIEYEAEHLAGLWLDDLMDECATLLPVESSSDIAPPDVPGGDGDEGEEEIQRTNRIQVDYDFSDEPLPCPWPPPGR